MRKWSAVIALVVMALSLGGIVVAPADAATKPGYPTASVAFQATTRTEPYLNNTYWGWALRNPGATSGDQTVSVSCWWDGDWATVTDYTNRWFLVFVYETYDGYAVPRWLFVHASYVFNQPSVPQCVSSPTGIWGPNGE